MNKTFAVAFLSLNTLLSANLSFAQSFSVEEALPNQISVPPSVLTELDRMTNFDKDGCDKPSLAQVLEATVVNISPASRAILVKPNAQGLCLCGAYYCPVWLFRESQSSTKLIWHTEGTSVVVVLKATTKGFRDLRSVGATASHGHSNTWSWNGKKYVLKKQGAWAAPR